MSENILKEMKLILNARNRENYYKRTINGTNKQIISKELQKKEDEKVVLKKADILYNEYINNKLKDEINIIATNTNNDIL